MKRRNQPWEGMARDGDRNVNYITASCLKIFLVSFSRGASPLSTGWSLHMGQLRADVTP